jgi:hypothetical protein
MMRTESGHYYKEPEGNDDAWFWVIAVVVFILLMQMLFSPVAH